jgi:hypothetical protein
VRPFVKLNDLRFPQVVAVDVLVCVFILALGALQFAFPLQSDDFFRGDTIYVELAQSILENRRYGVDYNDVQYPPGLPGLIALMCASVGCGHTVLVRSMSVFLALGLIASYWLLKRQEGVAVAATTCLLIASSPIVFALSTQIVFSDLPYFFTSITTLVLVAKMDRTAKALAQTLLLGLICTVMLVSSLLLRSSGVALIAGLVGWLAVGGLWTDKATRTRRLRTFAVILLAGIVVQAVWMAWVSMHETVEWPMLEGHPRSYLSHLIVKNGIQPELGTASLTDVVARVPMNLVDRATGLMQLLTRKEYIEATWYSPLVFGSVLLISLGLGSSLRSAGGSLAEWYFMAHEAMYLLWPWPFEIRFLLPVAPLACLYLWRGGAALGRMLVRRPRLIGVTGAVVGLLAGATAGAAGWNSNSMQPKLAAIFWTAIVIASVWMALPNRSKAPSLLGRDKVRHWVRLSGWRTRLRLLQIVGAATAAGLVTLGIGLQLGIGKQNLNFDLSQHPMHDTVAAAQWIADHAPGTAVVMVRQLDVVHHYAHRRVVWLPPISNPQVLMQGIRRLRTDFILVAKTWADYMPSDEDCIDAVLKEFPQSFRIAKEEPGFRIIEVVND